MTDRSEVTATGKTQLDTIVGMSLASFYKDISQDWWGRENEMVNLYAWCHLAKQVREGTVLGDIGQIGIEVAVRQLPTELLLKINPGRQRSKKDVRKDLVIWPSARMTLWMQSKPSNKPLAIMEWKVNHFHNSAAHRKNRNDYQRDIEWLRQTSAQEDMPGFVGYAVLVEDRREPKTLTCARVHAGSVNERFLELP